MKTKFAVYALILAILTSSCVGTGKTRHGSFRGTITPSGLVKGTIKVVCK